MSRRAAFQAWGPPGALGVMFSPAWPVAGWRSPASIAGAIFLFSLLAMNALRDAPHCWAAHNSR